MTQGILSKIFSRDDDEEVDVNFDLITPEEKPDISDNDSVLTPLIDKRRNQILSVWGSPSSGKTLMSVKIARYIASQKKNVVLVFGDLLAPPLPYVCGENSLECKNSMGDIFAAARINEDVIRQNVILHKRNEYLTMLGYLKSENIFSYPKHEKSHVLLFLECLREISDCIIIDCGSAFSLFTEVAVAESDVNLTLLNCDLKALSFYASYESFINNDKQIKAISDIKNFDAVDIFEQNIGGAHFRITHSDEVNKQFLNGNLLGALNQKDSTDFRKTVSKIANEVFVI
jgi:cellulose biosynthesis protein BcsQ